MHTRQDEFLLFFARFPKWPWKCFVHFSAEQVTRREMKLDRTTHSLVFCFLFFFCYQNWEKKKTRKRRHKSILLFYVNKTGSLWRISNHSDYSRRSLWHARMVPHISRFCWCIKFFLSHLFDRFSSLDCACVAQPITTICPANDIQSYDQFPVFIPNSYILDYRGQWRNGKSY